MGETSDIAIRIGRFMYQILLPTLIFVGITGLVYWLLFLANALKLHATDASLTQFNYNANNTLRYDLAVNLTLENPNKRIAIYYDRIEARALYQGQRFDSVQLMPFFQGHLSSNSLTAQFEGQRLVLLDVSNYNNDRISGLFDIQVKLHLQIRLKFALGKSPKMKPKFECDLRIPLRSNGTSGGGIYESKGCHFDWH